jgi:hypothetical protein
MHTINIYLMDIKMLKRKISLEKKSAKNGDCKSFRRGPGGPQNAGFFNIYLRASGCLGSAQNPS